VRLLDPIRNLLSHTGNDQASIAMSNRNNVMEILEPEYVQDVIDVGGQVDTWIGKMYPFAEAGECRTINFVALGS